MPPFTRVVPRRREHRPAHRHAVPGRRARHADAGHPRQRPARRSASTCAREDSDFPPFHLQVLELEGDRVEHVGAFFETRLFEKFGLPARLPAGLPPGRCPCLALLVGVPGRRCRPPGRTSSCSSGPWATRAPRWPACGTRPHWATDPVRAVGPAGLLRPTWTTRSTRSRGRRSGPSTWCPSAADRPRTELVERLQGKACALLGRGAALRPTGPSSVADHGAARPTCSAAPPALEITVHGWDVGRALGALRDLAR